MGINKAYNTQSTGRKIRLCKIEKQKLNCGGGQTFASLPVITNRYV